MPHPLLLWLSWRMDLGRASSNPSGACARSQASSMWPVHPTLRKLAPTLLYRNRFVHLLILVGRACGSELAVFDWWEAHQPLVGDRGPSVRVSARSAREKRIPYHCAHCYKKKFKDLYPTYIVQVRQITIQDCTGYQYYFSPKGPNQW